MIVWASVVLNMTVVDSDWHFDYLCSSHLQTLKISLVVKISATVNNSPIQDYTCPDDHIPPHWVPHNWQHHLNHLEHPENVLAFCLFLQLLWARGFICLIHW